MQTKHGPQLLSEQIDSFNNAGVETVCGALRDTAAA